MTLKFAVVLVALALPSHAVQVINIADGDTLTVLEDRKPVKIRLANIDAPEKEQPFGNRSKLSLSDLCLGKNATYQIQHIDRHGLIVAVVYCDDVNVNRAQVDRGMAWPYFKYNKDYLVNALQENALNAKRGLWADPNPVPPWEWRKQKRDQHQ